MNLKYGLSTTLHGIDCWLDKLDAAGAAGISGLEICLTADYEDQAASLPSAAKTIKGHNMEIFSVHLPFGDAVNIASPDETVRVQAVRQIKRFIALVGPLHAPRAVIHPSYEPIAAENRESCMQASMRSLKEIAEELKKWDCRLAAENLPRTCLGNCSGELARILEAVPEAGICFDTNHLTIQTPEDFADKMADHIITTHISDYDGIDEKHWCPGDGVLNFKYLHNTLIAHNYQGPLLFEPNEKSKDDVPVTPQGLMDGYTKAIRD